MPFSSKIRRGASRLFRTSLHGPSSYTTSSSTQPNNNGVGGRSYVEYLAEINHRASQYGLDLERASQMQYRLLKLSKVRQWDRMKRYQDLAADEYEDSNGDLTDFEQHLYFVSHRWLSSSHPDPEGTQLKRLKSLRDNDALLFYDYSSVPQETRDSTEQFVFDACLEKLNAIIPKMKVVILHDEEYLTRSWCLMEYFIAACTGSLVCDEVRDPQLLRLQSVVTLVVDGFEEMKKSSLMQAEARRARDVGEIAHHFFAQRFSNSVVTKNTDRGKIEDIFRRFIAQHVRCWDYIPYIGFKPRELTPIELEDMLHGKQVKLSSISHFGHEEILAELERVCGDGPVPDSSTAIPAWTAMQNKESPDFPNAEIPSSISSDLDQSWNHIVVNRIFQRQTRFYKLNDESAKLILKREDVPPFQFNV